jgi:hypothetical protein
MAADPNSLPTSEPDQLEAATIHTMKGKAMGRGLDHFRKEGAKLIPPPTADDPDEAYRLWTIKQRSK